MHIVHGQLRKAPFVKVLTDSTMFCVELSELIKDYKTGEKTYTNYKAILFAKSEAHVNHYNQTLVEGNFIVLTSEKLKIEVSPCGQYTKLFMDNARLEGSGFIQGQQAPQQQAPQQQTPRDANGFTQQQGGFQQQAPKVNPQEPSIDFDDSIPF
jgi:hypothetical protein